jgi:hypothetical protein
MADIAKSAQWYIPWHDIEEDEMLRQLAVWMDKLDKKNGVFWVVLFLVHRFLSPWWRRRQVPPKRRFLQEPHGITTQKTQFFKSVLFAALSKPLHSSTRFFFVLLRPFMHLLNRVLFLSYFIPRICILYFIFLNFFLASYYLLFLPSPHYHVPLSFSWVYFTFISYQQNSFNNYPSSTFFCCFLLLIT